MKIVEIIFSASLLLLSAGLYAQPQGGPQGGSQGGYQGGHQYGAKPAPPKMKSPEEVAKTKADAMKSEVGLTDKQYKKVYNLVKKDQEYRRSQAEKQFSYGMPPQGGPGGMGGPGDMGGFGGGMMGGMPPQGGPGMGGNGGGMMGGMPPQGGSGGMGGPGNGPRPKGGPGMGPGEDLVSEEYLEKQDKKLKKILTEDQYSAWRAKHPAEHLDLPPVEFK